MFLGAPQLEPSSTILDVKKLFAKQSEFSNRQCFMCGTVYCIVVHDLLACSSTEPKFYPNRQQFKLSKEKRKSVAKVQMDSLHTSLLPHLPSLPVDGFPVVIHTCCLTSFPLHISFPSSNSAEAKSLKDNVTLESLKIKDGGALYFKDLGKLHGTAHLHPYPPLTLLMVCASPV